MASRILFFVAHPDDEVLGGGGSIARWVSEGHKVFVWFATNGVSSRDSPLETAESRWDSAKQAMDVLGVAEIFCADFPDNKMDSISRLHVCKAMESVAQLVEPTLVITHSQADLNVDHRLVGECAAVVSRPVPESSIRALWHLSIPSSTGWFPDSPKHFSSARYVALQEKHLTKKLEALQRYHLEIPEWPHARSLEAVLHHARATGSLVGVPAAEAYSLSFELI